jgi:replicative DNA helicase
MAGVLESDELANIARSDLFWDRIVEITPLGEQPTFDVTVEGTHNFIADGVVVHNSIEQDADMVMFLYRDEYYNSDSDDKGIAEVIERSYRQGPARLDGAVHQVCLTGPSLVLTGSGKVPYGTNR